MIVMKMLAIIEWGSAKLIEKIKILTKSIVKPLFM